MRVTYEEYVARIRGAAAAEKQKAAEQEAHAAEAIAQRQRELDAGAAKTHEEKVPDDYDMSPFAKYFKKFSEVLYDTRAYNVTSP